MTWAVRAPVFQPHASQFAYGLKGSCTLLALAACEVVSKGQSAYVGDPHVTCPNPASSENVQALMYRIYQQARAKNLCAPNGGATQYDMLKMAAIIGLPVKDVLYYAEPQPTDAWVNFLRRYVAHAAQPYPVLMQFSNGQALRDAESGTQDEKGLRYHAAALFGTQTDPENPKLGGYIGCDGDNATVSERPIIYSLPVLAAARPISIIAFDYVKAKG